MGGVLSTGETIVRRVRHSASCVPLLAALLVSPASAECPPDRGAASFERGRERMNSGDYEAACAAFRTSLACDGTKAGRLFALAHCEDLAGSLAAAVPLYEEYLRRFAEMPADLRAEHRKRADISRDRVEASRLESRIRLDE